MPFVKTAHSRVQTALRALRLSSSDVFVDLGCGDARLALVAAIGLWHGPHPHPHPHPHPGDGRLALAAATDYGATAVGIDISPGLLRACRRAAELAG